MAGEKPQNDSAVPSKTGTPDTSRGAGDSLATPRIAEAAAEFLSRIDDTIVAKIVLESTTRDGGYEVSPETLDRLRREVVSRSQGVDKEVVDLIINHLLRGVRIYVGEASSATNAGPGEPRDVATNQAFNLRSAPSHSPVFPNFSRVLDLFSYLLPGDIRESVFDHARCEIEKDLAKARRKYKKKWERRWLIAAFTVRSALLVLGCLRVWIVERCGAWFPWLVAAWRWLR